MYSLCVCTLYCRNNNSSTDKPVYVTAVFAAHLRSCLARFRSYRMNSSDINWQADFVRTGWDLGCVIAHPDASGPNSQSNAILFGYIC